MSTDDGLFANGDSLYLLDFHSADLVRAVAPLYRDLLDQYDPSDVLILKRFPTGIEMFSSRLLSEVGGVDRPEILSLNRHAADTLSRSADTRRGLSDYERIQLVETFLGDRGWESSYLEQAATKRSFFRDVGRLMLVLSWQGGIDDTPDNPVLAEIADATDEFHDYLANLGYLERGQVVTEVTSLLEDPDFRQEVQRDFEVVIALEFEEFAALDRAYLEQLTNDVPLVRLSEDQSSIQRTWNESGTVDNGEIVQELTPTDSPATGSRPRAIAEYLATGESTFAPDTGTVQVIVEPTFEDQLREVADEIDRLRDANGWSYDQFAIGFKDSNAPINEAIRQLRQAGIPTASATVTGFSDDPAVRELYSLARKFESSGKTARDNIGESLPAEFVDIVDRIDPSAGLETVLWQWIAETDMKDRIASLDSPLEARAQFDHVKDVVALTSFIEDTDVLESSWEGFVTGLERMFEYTAPDTHTSEVDVKEDGVLVDAVRVMKNASWKAVFMLNVVEETYPSTPSLTSLFPPSQVKKMDSFPGVTTPTAEDVRSTFSTTPAAIDDPFEQYYGELSRRILAVGCRSATERLYFGVYDREDPTTGKRTQPSRFLVELYEEFPWIEEFGQDGIHGQAGATSFALNRTDRALHSIKRSPIVNESINLDELDKDMVAIQELLNESGPRGEALREAIRARVDFAEGRIRNE